MCVQSKSLKLIYRFVINIVFILMQMECFILEPNTKGTQKEHTKEHKRNTFLEKMIK